MAQYVGEDGFKRMTIDGEIYILIDLFHYRHMAVKQAKDYTIRTKIATIKDGGNKGMFGIWSPEKEYTPVSS